MARLEGKTAIVTGGARGIGRHYSQALAAEGARVMIADIADGKELAAEIAGRHGANSVASIKFDVSDEKAIKNVVAQTIERFGQIDILVNNAALYSTLKPQKFQRVGRGLVGSRHGDQRARAVSDGPPCRAAHDRAPHRQDHQHRVRRRLQGRAAHAALCHVERRHAGLHPRAVARARTIRHRGQFAVAGLYPQRYRVWRTRPMWKRSACPCATAAPSSATPIRKTCSARWCSWPRATAISSPASRWWWTAARSITSAILSGRDAHGIIGALAMPGALWRTMR